MKVYIKKLNHEFENVNFFIANTGFKELGFEIVYYENITKVLDNREEDIVVGGISDVRYVLDKFNKDYPTLEYPEKLFKDEYLGRKLWVDTLGSVMNDKNKWGIFIKPVEGGKLFPGTVINNLMDFRNCYGLSSDTKIWCSEQLDFVSEYRCFIRYGEIIGVKHYKGDIFKSPSKDILLKMINDYIDSPKAYTIDLGVTDKGKTYLIEVNEGYSVGAYGLDPIKYSKLLATRWAELTKTEDLLFL